MPETTNILASDGAALSRLAGKKFLITGGDGMLALAFRNQIERHVPGAGIYSPGRAQLDVTQVGAFDAWESIRPDVVIHCAALVDADRCEVQTAEAQKSIVGGTCNVAQFAARVGARLMYPQSFLIYDGAEPEIDERTVPRPLGVYGLLKLEAEQVALALCPATLSVRMAGFFGGNAADDNFVGRITPHLAKLVREGVASIDIGDRVWQPTSTQDLAANSLLLLAHSCSGIYCMASRGSASFHELTQEIAKLVNVADRIAIGRVDAALLAAKEKAKRPPSAIIRNARLLAEGLDRQRAWQSSLAEYINQPYFQDMFR